MKESSDDMIGDMIHYPDCWDSCAYPTLASALWEMVRWNGVHPICPSCGKEQGWSRNYNKEVDL